MTFRNQKDYFWAQIKKLKVSERWKLDCKKENP